MCLWDHTDGRVLYKMGAFVQYCNTDRLTSLDVEANLTWVDLTILHLQVTHTVVRVSGKSGVIHLSTDKPVYMPGQTGM